MSGFDECRAELDECHRLLDGALETMRDIHRDTDKLNADIANCAMLAGGFVPLIIVIALSAIFAWVK